DRDQAVDRDAAAGLALAARRRRIEVRQNEAAHDAGHADAEAVGGRAGRADRAYRLPAAVGELDAALAVRNAGVALPGTNRRDRDVESGVAALDRLRDARLRGAREDFTRHALNFDRVRIEIRLPTEETPVLTEHHVDHGRLDLEGEVTHAERGVREELLL